MKLAFLRVCTYVFIAMALAIAIRFTPKLPEPDRRAAEVLTVQAATPSWMPDVPVTGHEFHRTAVDGIGDAAWESGEGFVQESVHASYLHLHWAGVPGVADRFVAACG